MCNLNLKRNIYGRIGSLILENNLIERFQEKLQCQGGLGFVIHSTQLFARKFSLNNANKNKRQKKNSYIFFSLALTLFHRLDCSAINKQIIHHNKTYLPKYTYENHKVCEVTSLSHTNTSNFLNIKKLTKKLCSSYLPLGYAALLMKHPCL